jgi:FKBP-type peptidyl-prolyl cis-trans isomerase
MAREFHVASLSSHVEMEETLPPPAKAASRRAVLHRSIQWAATTAAAGATAATAVLPAASAEETVSTAEGSNVPKFVQEYSDFVESPRGFSYRIVPSPTSTASSAVAAKGDRVVFDWSGYTIGYFGRPFQAKGGPQGGAFDKDLDYARVVLGSHSIVEGLELALEGMRAGEVRQVIIPYGKLSYPEDDPGHDRVGPKPYTFSGERALDFVLQNPRLDRTLLFNVKVIRVDKPNGKGGFVRG